MTRRALRSVCSFFLASLVVPFAPGGTTDLVGRTLAEGLGNRWGNTTSNIQSLPELIARLKARPGVFNYGSSGVGTSIHLSTLMFLNGIGAQATHIQYKGSAPALVAIASGEINILFDNHATAMPLVQGQKVTGLALSSASRGGLATTLPTMSEAGLPGFDSLTWIGLLAPAGTPQPVVRWLNAEVAAVMSEPSTVARLAELGFTPRRTALDSLRDFIRQEAARNVMLVKDNGIQPE